MPERATRPLPPVRLPPRTPVQVPPQDEPHPEAQVLHLTIIAPTLAIYLAIKDKIRLVRPPYWKGTVTVHVLIDNPKHPLDTGPLMVAQAAYELGWGTPDSLVVEEPQVSLGFPK